MNREEITDLLKRKNINGHMEHLYKYMDLCFGESNIDLTEKHHILPASMFPNFKNLSKFKWNMVKLTPSQHCLAHYHLAKFLDDDKSWNSLTAMLSLNVESRSRVDLEYVSMCGKIRSEWLKNFRGKNHNMYGKKQSEELIMKRADALRNKRKSQEHCQSLRDSKRNKSKNPMWFMPLKRILYDLWVEHGMPKRGRFSTICKTNGHNIERPDNLIAEFIKFGFIYPPEV